MDTATLDKGERTLAALRRLNKESTSHEVAAEAGIDPNDVAAHLRRFIHQGLVLRGGTTRKATYTPVAEKPAPAPAPLTPPGPIVGTPKTLSTRLDPGLYKQLRLHAVETDRTHQDIMVDALVAYLAARKA